MSLMGGLLSGVALMIAALTLIAVTWSIARPDRRVWPPQTFGPTVSVVSWSATLRPPSSSSNSISTIGA